MKFEDLSLIALIAPHEIARQTGILLVVVRNGVLMEIDSTASSFDEEGKPSLIRSCGLTAD
jgi:hypothetical protein